MAETVQYYLEQMVPELEDLEQKKIFTKAEIKVIIKRRTTFEYSLKRIQPQKMDFLRYIEYEMNLEQLRIKRRKRTNIKGKTTISDYAIPRRIYQIYDRALIKFKGDVALWLQYIDYAKTSGAGKLLGKIYGRAIQLHPTKPELWILAAKWEFESNANIVAARVLMQRGLRFNNASKQLWQEYFKLELLYVEKITTRRKILGILSKEDKKHPEEELEIDEEPDEVNMIRLPKLTGEDLYLYENKKPLSTEIDEKQVEKLKEDNNKMLQGAIARTVFENAIKAIPDDLIFRQKFIDICCEFTNIKEALELIYNSIQQDFFNDAKARAFLAERHVTSILNIESPEFINALKKSINEFEQSIEKLMNTEIWYLYTKFLTKYFHRVTEPNLRRYFSKLLTKVYETTDTKNLTSNEMYFDWAKFVSSQLDSHELALEILEKGTHKYPNYAKLWIKRINITLELKDDTKKNNLSLLFDEALKLNPVSQELWKTYLDWLFKRFSNGELVESKLDNLLMNSMLTVSSLSGSSSISNSSTELRTIQYVVASRYLAWAKDQGGIENARKIYESLISKTLPTRSFFEICINLEKENLEPSTQSNDIERVNRLYDQSLSITEYQQNNNDNDDAELWLAYIGFLLDNKQFSKANHIYWKAHKLVPNPESFEVEYRALLNLRDINDKKVV
ncbi:10171_t:CDS:10 [Ambispora gerdemannii]|uniref:10171_t:CDS:1 n=1 Tax=Ambispora gerdemannii TaxID=144530 RepID=A0A9N8VUW1_9GLOM|nr:10171_t:CDS:10 [Ambispora gerdemannii]